VLVTWLLCQVLCQCDSYLPRPTNKTKGAFHQRKKTQAPLSRQIQAQPIRIDIALVDASPASHSSCIRYMLVSKAHPIPQSSGHRPIQPLNARSPTPTIVSSRVIANAYILNSDINTPAHSISPTGGGGNALDNINLRSLELQPQTLDTQTLDNDDDSDEDCTPGVPNISLRRLKGHHRTPGSDDDRISVADHCSLKVQRRTPEQSVLHTSFLMTPSNSVELLPIAAIKRENVLSCPENHDNPLPPVLSFSTNLYDPLPQTISELTPYLLCSLSRSLTYSPDFPYGKSRIAIPKLTIPIFRKWKAPYTRHLFSNEFPSL